jgi:hypothetical protein
MPGTRYLKQTNLLSEVVQTVCFSVQAAPLVLMSFQLNPHPGCPIHQRLRRVDEYKIIRFHSRRGSHPSFIL